MQSSDLEINPGPKRYSRLKFCHWNLNGITAYDHVKMPLIESSINVNNIDIAGMSETFLDSATALDTVRIYMKGYSMIRADHPSNRKKRSVCTYYK